MPTNIESDESAIRRRLARLGSRAFASLGLFLVSAILLTLWFFTISASSTVSLDGLSRVAGGGTCDWRYYDHAGTGYSASKGTVDYAGPAPLYSLGFEFMHAAGPPNRGSPCTEVFPTTISSTLVLSATAVFPWMLTVSLPDSKLSPGESALLSAKLEVFSEFNASNTTFSSTSRSSALQALPFIVSFDSAHDKHVSLRLEGVGFEIAPPPDRVMQVPIQYGRPASQQWAIAPRDHLAGDQHLFVDAMVGDERRLDAMVIVRVKPTLGITRTQMVLLGGITGALAWLLLQWKTLLEIRNLRHQLGQQRRTKTAK